LNFKPSKPYCIPIYIYCSIEGRNISYENDVFDDVCTWEIARDLFFIFHLIFHNCIVMLQYNYPVRMNDTVCNARIMFAVNTRYILSRCRSWIKTDHEMEKCKWRVVYGFQSSKKQIHKRIKVHVLRVYF
jgi:hypothetical protein